MAKALLQLIRLPNLFTAAADSLAGWWIVAGSLDRPGLWIPLVLASMAIYAGGIALNDYVDRAIDAVERPRRPIPSGRVGPRFALILAIVLLSVGWILTAVPGVGSALVGGMLVLCVVSYNTVAKRTLLLGPIVMGTCRALNLLLGMSLSPDWGGQIGDIAATSYLVFVAGITFLSRSEMATGERSGLGLGLALESLGLVGFAVVAIRAWGPDRAFPWSGLLLLSAVTFAVARAGGRAWRQANPQATQAAVKAGIFSLVWLDAALVASSQGPLPAISVAALWLPAYFLGKWLYAT